jgi:hypothetical protein
VYRRAVERTLASFQGHPEVRLELGGGYSFLGLYGVLMLCALLSYQLRRGVEKQAKVAPQGVETLMVALRSVIQA